MEISKNKTINIHWKIKYDNILGQLFSPNTTLGRERVFWNDTFNYIMCPKNICSEAFNSLIRPMTPFFSF